MGAVEPAQSRGHLVQRAAALIRTSGYCAQPPNQCEGKSNQGQSRIWGPALHLIQWGHPVYCPVSTSLESTAALQVFKLQQVNHCSRKKLLSSFSLGLCCWV